MYSIKLVKSLSEQDMVRFGRRVSTITSSEHSFPDKVIPLMKTNYNKVDKSFTIGITNMETQDVAIDIHYEITKPPYFVWKSLAATQLDEVNQRLNEYTIEEVKMVESEDSPFLTFQTETYFDESKREEINYYLNIKKDLENKIAQLEQESDEWQQKHGYGIIITVKTGELGCDIKYIRLMSSSGILMFITHNISGQMARLWQFSDKLMPLYQFNLENFNKNYLSNQTFTFMDVFTRPDILLWVECSLDGERWFQVFNTYTLIQLHGLKYGRVIKLDEDNDLAIVEDDGGGLYETKLSDYSFVGLGSRVVVTRTGAGVRLTPDYSSYYNMDSVGVKNTISYHTLDWEDLN